MGATIYCICNQKGGCAKTVTAINLGIGFVRKEKHVPLVDVDSQGSMIASLGWQQPLFPMYGGCSIFAPFLTIAGNR